MIPMRSRRTSNCFAKNLVCFVTLLSLVAQVYDATMKQRHHLEELSSLLLSGGRTQEDAIEPNTGKETKQFFLLPEVRELYQYLPPEPRNPQHDADAQLECGESPFPNFFRQRSRRRSRRNEDKIIYNHFFIDLPFDELRTYKFIEIGGYNGMDESNSRFFETCLGWEGLLVEPNPTPFQQLVQNRPLSHRASFAASCSLEEAHFNHTIAFHDYPFANAAQAGTNNAYAGRRTVDVPCGPLTSAIQELFHGHVHFFSLDVEGAEPFVLKHIDFSSVFIDILLVEVENHHCTPKEFCLSRNQTRTILSQHGYHRFEKFISASDLYVHPQSPFLSKMDTITRTQ